MPEIQKWNGGNNSNYNRIKKYLELTKDIQNLYFENCKMLEEIKEDLNSGKTSHVHLSLIKLRYFPNSSGNARDPG